MADVAPQGSEAAPSNTNTNAEANAPAESQPATPPAQGENNSAPQNEQIFSHEEQAELKKFIDNNGGLDKIKQNLFARKADMKEAKQQEQGANTEPQQPLQPAEAQQPAQPQAGGTQPAQGFLSPQDIIAKTYNNQLESDSNYANIKEYIHKGEYLTEMQGMGMTPVDANGNFNDKVIRQWLDIKSKTAPSLTPSTPVTTTPTVEYTKFEDGIDTFDKAMKVYSEGDGNPQFAEAEKMIAQHFNGVKPEAK